MLHWGWGQAIDGRFRDLCFLGLSFPICKMEVIILKWPFMGLVEGRVRGEKEA